MHSAVMQNKDYIKFANKSTVEVLALSSLEKGIQKGDRRADRYEATRDGETVEMMVSWPGLTLDEIVGMRKTQAGQYNDTGAIPYTAIVDPHTLEKMTFFKGGQSASTLIDAVKEQTKKLVAEHGKGMSRRDLAAIAEAIAEARELVAEGNYSKAISGIDKASKGAEEWPQSLSSKLSTARADVISSAEQKLDAIEEMVESDPLTAKRELGRLISKLRGTGLDDRARELRSEL